MNYNELIANITSNYTYEELEHICKGLNKQYNIYDTEDTRWTIISYHLFRTTKEEIDVIRKASFSNQFISDLFLKYYVCERVVKYFLIKKLFEMEDDIVAFEMAVGESRIDVCRINGGSYAYEIKTQYDSYERLSTQMNDYMKAFQKVYVVVPRSRVMDVQSFIPAGCGIISYKQTSNNELVFSFYKRSEKNQCDLKVCLLSLSSSDLSALLKLAGLKKRESKEDKLQSLIDFSENHNIWPAYRKLLKEKYRSNWQFLKDHFEDIIPIDIQNFFSNNLNPSLLYETNKERSD